MGPRGGGGITVRAGRRTRAPHDRGDGAKPPREIASADGVDSPLIAQYVALKREHPEALLLSRVGDFYEAYGDDADDLARSLHIVLTSKDAGKGKRVAMAGVPYHSLDPYLARLMRQQRVVAIAEQMEAPVPNRLVRREVVRVLTPGTVSDEGLLDPERNNYLCAVARARGFTAVACADVSTGDATIQVASNDDELAAELERIRPAEAIVPSAIDAERVRAFAGERCRVAVHEAEPGVARAFAAIRDLSEEEGPSAAAALDLLASYLDAVKLDGASLTARARPVPTSAAMLLDASTRRHLDLLAGSGDERRASLLGVLGRTKTPMGHRLLAARIGAPLVDPSEIERRLDRVAALVGSSTLRAELHEGLAAIGDVERIVQRARSRRAGPRDLAALRRGLQSALEIAERLAAAGDAGLAPLGERMRGGGATAHTVSALAALVDEPPQTLADGGALKPESDVRLHEAVAIRSEARERLLALEAATRSRSGIRSLKIRYTQAFGYYFEIPRSATTAIPDDFTRRQSLVNAERFTNGELKALEAEILGAQSRQVAVERELFDALQAEVAASVDGLLAAGAALAEIDVHCALAQVAAERRYVRPQIATESVIDVADGRHPVVEAFGGVDFVANDCHADAQSRFLLITGPNMGGKSTYLRQTALISIMAQMGSFVPATTAKLGIVDRLFTRIGAGDDIAAGRSTFFVEMAEMAVILRRCTPRSLLLIDEVGRGTGTADGLAIAQAIGEHLLALDRAMPIVLFATHFHELVALAKTFHEVKNLHVVVADEAAGPVFSHRLLTGASSRSYGIAVARMAGLPPDVVDRALEIADEIEERPEPKVPARRRRSAAGPDGQLSLEIE